VNCLKFFKVFSMK